MAVAPPPRSREDDPRPPAAFCQAALSAGARSLMLGDRKPPPLINGGTDHSVTGQRRRRRGPNTIVRQEDCSGLPSQSSVARRIGTSCRSRDSEGGAIPPHVGAQPTQLLFQRDGAQSSSMAPNAPRRTPMHKCKGRAEPDLIRSETHRSAGRAIPHNLSKDPPSDESDRVVRSRFFSTTRQNREGAVRDAHIPY